MSIFSPISLNGKQSKFATRVKVRSAFFPGQTISASGKLGESEPLVPLSYMEKRRKMKPANDTAPVFCGGQKQFVAKAETGSQFMRKTVSTLLSLGAVPVKFLNELGFFRYVKERQYNSQLRLDTSLGQGHECAEQFVRMNLKRAKKTNRNRCRSHPLRITPTNFPFPRGISALPSMVYYGQ